MILMKRTAILLLIYCWVFSHLHSVWCSKSSEASKQRSSKHSQGCCSSLYRQLFRRQPQPNPQDTHAPPAPNRQDTLGDEWENTLSYKDQLSKSAPPALFPNVAVYWHEGKENTLKDRFFVDTDMCDMGFTLAGIFSGYKSSTVADLGADYLMVTLRNRICEIKEYIQRKRTDEFQLHEYIEYNGSINYEKLLTDDIRRFDDKVLNFVSRHSYDRNTGSTALIVLIDGQTLIVANIGDDRAVMATNKGTSLSLTEDHTVENPKERKRIEKAGGNIISVNGVDMVDGKIKLTRTLGERELKKENHGVTANPDIKRFNLSEYKPKFLIMATSGLWATFSNDEAVNFIQDNTHDDTYATKDIVQKVNEKRAKSMVNITVMVLNIDGFPF